MTDVLEFDGTISRPLINSDINSLIDVITFRKDLPDGPKTQEWYDRQTVKFTEILEQANPNREVIGTFKDGELIAIVEASYSSSIPYWFNPYLEAKYPSSKSLSRDLVHNGIAVSLNLACLRAEERGYFTWFWLRTVRETKLFNALLDRSGYTDNTSEKLFYPGRGRYNFYVEDIIKKDDLPRWQHHKHLMSTPLREDVVVSLGSLKSEHRMQYLGLSKKDKNV